MCGLERGSPRSGATRGSSLPLAEVRNVQYAARNVEKIRAPILLLDGADDAVVPVLQSRIMATALKEQSRAVELIELPGEDHWLSRGDTRTQVLTEIERFLANKLPAS